ncbi:MAG: hypothetical protein HY270_14455, partial [Deltaproteobacteria bacterium]|nr:hypothetical protein [Deltaproteobacteria bacterium]
MSVASVHHSNKSAALAVRLLAAVALSALAAATPGVVFAVVGAGAISPQPQKGSYAPPAGSGPYAPGRLIVRMKDAVSVCVDCLIERKQSLAPALGSNLFDDLNLRYGLRSARPLRKADVPIASLAERRQREGARRSRMTVPGYSPRSKIQQAPSLASTYVLELATGIDMEAVAREYARDPNVVYAEPDRIVQVALLPNDPYFASKGAWRQDFDDLWGLKIISAPAAWDSASGSGVVVAVTDTGLDSQHPDIASNLWINPGEIPDNGVDDDNNGYVDDVSGWNFVDNNN